MGWVILGLIAFIVITVLVAMPDYMKEKEVILKSQQHIDQLKGMTEKQQYYIGEKCIGLYPRKGYEKFPIAGAYYRNLPVTMVGKFNGYARSQSDNEYDKYAIAIYNDKGTHLGFLPRGNSCLHSYILNEGTTVHAYGYIGCHNDGGMYGEVCVEVDKNAVTKRNKPYKID